MKERIERNDLYAMQPAIVKCLRGLGDAAAEVIDAGLIHLVKIRASQINGCGFCMHMHAAEARGDNENQERLDVLPAWREMACFTPQERAALAWCEALTRVAQNGVSETVFAEVSAHFNPEELASLTAAIIAINGWNRIAVSYGFQPDVKE